MVATLYDILNISEKDFDTYDTEFDTTVTVCWIDREKEDYDKFCNGITKKVNVIKKVGDGLLVNWSDLIKRNMEKFRQFTQDNWSENCQYEDDEDEFVYQWIREIHLYMAGYVSERFYKKLVAFVEKLV
jgi:hypothetical protein